MDGESGSTGSKQLTFWLRATVAWMVFVGLMVFVPASLGEDVLGGQDALAEQRVVSWPEISGLMVLLLFSAYFSASEAAFSSLHNVRLRGMAEESGITGPMISRLLEHRGRLLYTILIGNMIVNVFIGLLMPRPIGRFFETMGVVNPIVVTVSTVALTTLILVFFGEITPKVFAERVSERFCRLAVIPLKGIDTMLGPIRWVVLKVTEFFFRITRFNDIKPPPFITDEEFKSVLTESEERGVIETEEGQMIQGILEMSDRMLREILVPRPDVIAIEHDATVLEALELFKQRENSRVPIYNEDLDHITGLLFAKDLLPRVARDEGQVPVKTLARRAEFVPETMSVRDFLRFAQRHRTHLAIVVDEYGGTAGIVTLEDAIEEVVGDIHDENEEEEISHSQLRQGVYRVNGNMPLDELSELVGVEIIDEEHETVAGFFMDQMNKVPEEGDRLEHNSLAFTVEALDGKRIESLRVEKPSGSAEREAS